MQNMNTDMDMDMNMNMRISIGIDINSTCIGSPVEIRRQGGRRFCEHNEDQ